MKLTIAMATHNDYDGVYFTLQSIRLYQHLVDVEYIVLDNNPTSLHGEKLRKLCGDIPGCKLVPVTDRMSSFVKYDAFQHATGDVVLIMDCHVLLVPEFVSAMMRWWAAHPDSRDMLTGPVVYNNLTSCSTRMNPEWRGHDFGTWGDDKEALQKGVPFEVPMQGMGCFSVRREAWQGINPHFRGFGAEEWYCAEKIRQWGGKVMCHPAMRWVHRFGWPVRTFPLSMEIKIVNYYRGWLELYGSRDHPQIQAMTAHWLTQVKPDKLERLIQKAQEIPTQP